MKNKISVSESQRIFYSKEVAEELDKLYKANQREKNPSVTIFASMVYGFAYHLPYSMDIEQEEYVPGDFLNIEPEDVDENAWFKWDDRRTYFNAMYNCDAWKSGILLQTCYIFQQLLLGNIQPEELSDEKCRRISSVSRDNDYDDSLFGVLKNLPLFYQQVVSTSNNEERRRCLEKVFQEMQQKIGMRVGGFRESSIDKDGNEIIVRDYKPTVLCPAYRDVELPIYSGNYTFYDGLELELTKTIKNEQLHNYKLSVPQKSIEESSSIHL